MVRVSGPLVNVTTSASSVRDVQVHTKKVRAWGDGLMTPDPSQATLSNGAVEFEAAPGPVVMVLFMAEAGAETVSLVVGEGATQSLADAYRDGQMANDRDASELAGILEQIRASVGASAEARAGAEAAAEDAAGSAVSAGRDADRAETAEAGAVEAEEGAEAGQELSEDAAAVAVAAAVGAAEASSDKADTTYVDAADQALGQRIDAEKWVGPNLTATSDIKTLKPGHSYGVPNLTIAQALGLPPLRGALEVIPSSTRIMYRYTTWQGEFPPASNKQMWFADLDTKGNLTNWQRIAWANEIPKIPEIPEIPDQEHYSLRHDLQVNEAKMLAGQRTVTGTGVALVFDHGTNYFNETLLPMLRARGLTATIALNSQMYAPSAARYEFDNRTDWDIITQWWTQDGIEIANHGRTHRSSPDDAGNIHDAVGGLEELRAAMPTVPIHSFVTPASLPLIKGIADLDTPFGRELWANHAIMVSAANPKAWPLVGDIRQGVGRVWIDSPAGITSSQNAVLNTAPGQGIIVSGHPEVIDTPGRTTTAELEAFLDWVVQQRDAGRITVMTLRELAFAKPAPAGAATTVDTTVGTRIMVGDTMVHGDTGWRLLPNYHDEQEQTGQIFIRRIGDRCSIRVVDFTMPGNYAKHMAVLPSGFRSQTQFYGILVDQSASSTNSVVGSYTLNRFSWTRDINGGYERPDHPQSGELDYLTDDAWPSTLPGTPS